MSLIIGGRVPARAWTNQHPTAAKRQRNLQRVVSLGILPPSTRSLGEQTDDLAELEFLGRPPLFCGPFQLNLFGVLPLSRFPVGIRGSPLGAFVVATFLH